MAAMAENLYLYNVFVCFSPVINVAKISQLAVVSHSEGKGGTETIMESRTCLQLGRTLFFPFS